MWKYTEGVWKQVSQEITPKVSHKAFNYKLDYVSVLQSDAGSHPNCMRVQPRHPAPRRQGILNLCLLRGKFQGKTLTQGKSLSTAYKAEILWVHINNWRPLERLFKHFD